MIATKTAEKLRQYKIRFSLIVEQILALALSTNIVREAKNLSQISNKLREDVLRY